MTDLSLSPCIRVCTLDASGQICIGCFRTVDEIGLWARLSHAERARVMEELPERRRRHERSSLQRCEGCGSEFWCGAADPSEPCWCTGYPAVKPTEADASCLCPLCLAALAPG